MLESIIKKYKFSQLNSLMDSIKTEITEETVKEKYGDTEVNAKLNNGLNLKVFITKISTGADWISFHLYKDSLNIEQITYLISPEKENDYNRVIRHDYFTIDEDTATTFNSAYTYSDDEYLSGWKQIRRVNYKDIEKWAGKGDNLANLACNIDSSKIEVIHKDSKKNIEEEPIITTKYLNNEPPNIKVLTNN